MLRFFSLLLLLSLGTQAELPKKRSMIELKTLWENSPFTTKPVIETDQKNELQDWSLAGVSSNPKGGYTITIVHKKDRLNRQRIHSTGDYLENSAKGYKILEVAQQGYDYKKTRVKLSIGNQVGWVSYDEKVLAVKPAIPVKRGPTRPAVNRPNTLPIPAANNNAAKKPATQNSSRRPRIRRVPPQN